MDSLHPYAWLQADCLTVAPTLLGWELVSQIGGLETGGRIIEVEAYHGVQDPASHAYRGLTPRTAPMFEAGGTIYVYLSYGMHTCMNIVTGPAGDAQALLIRALEPTRGLEIMAERRKTTNQRLFCNGPGKLGQALGLNLTLSGTRLGQTLSLRPPQAPSKPVTVSTGPRIGIKQATELPWRFYETDNPYVSK